MSQRDLFAHIPAHNSAPEGVENRESSDDRTGIDGADCAHIRWPTFERYRTDYDTDRPPLAVADGWDRLVQVTRARDAARLAQRKQEP